MNFNMKESYIIGTIELPENYWVTNYTWEK